MEVLGILGNLSLPEIDFEKVVRELDLLPFITSKLKVSELEYCWYIKSVMTRHLVGTKTISYCEPCNTAFQYPSDTFDGAYS